jgi:hypothetical protein
VKIAPNFLQHSYFHLDSPLLVWGLVEAEPLTFTLPPQRFSLPGSPLLLAQNRQRANRNHGVGRQVSLVRPWWWPACDLSPNRAG